jgi:hypothetical protein
MEARDSAASMTVASLKMGREGEGKEGKDQEVEEKRRWQACYEMSWRDTVLNH